MIKQSMHVMLCIRLTPAGVAYCALQVLLLKSCASLDCMGLRWHSFQSPAAESRCPLPAHKSCCIFTCNGSMISRQLNLKIQLYANYILLIYSCTNHHEAHTTLQVTLRADNSSNAKRKWTPVLDSHLVSVRCNPNDNTFFVFTSATSFSFAQKYKHTKAYVAL